MIWAINSVCHCFGTRPHATGDDSTNNPWLCWITFGECWHNNHHHAPTHARFGHGWTQPDPGWWTIVVLRRLGWVQQVLGEQLNAQQRGRSSAA
jgi:stearoyl-CoA desaturase (delta-9 desaturase)